MRKTLLTLLCGLALAGCGYRAPLHQSYIPVVTDSTLYSGVRADYQQLAALMEKDTGMKPIEGNTVSLVFEGQSAWIPSARSSRASSGKKPLPGSMYGSSWTSRPTRRRISGN